MDVVINPATIKEKVTVVNVPPASVRPQNNTATSSSVAPPPASTAKQVAPPQKPVSENKSGIPSRAFNDQPQRRTERPRRPPRFRRSHHRAKSPKSQEPELEAEDFSHIINPNKVKTNKSIEDVPLVDSKKDRHDAKSTDDDDDDDETGDSGENDGTQTDDSSESASSHRRSRRHSERHRRHSPKARRQDADSDSESASSAGSSSAGSSSTRSETKQPPPETKTESMDIEKRVRILARLARRKKAHPLSVGEFSEDMPISRLEFLDAQSKHEVDGEQTLQLMKRFIMFVVSVSESLSASYPDIGLDLEGWTSHVLLTMAQYEDTMYEIYDQYLSGATVNPLVKLGVGLASNAWMYSTSRKVAKQLPPQLASMLNQGQTPNETTIQDMLASIQKAAAPTTTTTTTTSTPTSTTMPTRTSAHEHKSVAAPITPAAPIRVNAAASRPPSSLAGSAGQTPAHTVTTPATRATKQATAPVIKVMKE